MVILLLYAALITDLSNRIADGQLLQLVKFYGMNNPDKKSRSGNINWFLQFSGVAFQYVHD